MPRPSPVRAEASTTRAGSVPKPKASIRGGPSPAISTSVSRAATICPKPRFTALITPAIGALISTRALSAAFTSSACRTIACDWICSSCSSATAESPIGMLGLTIEACSARGSSNASSRSISTSFCRNWLSSAGVSMATSVAST